MPRMGLDAIRVAGAAADIADADGLEAITLARVADQLGVRAPSLYNHVDGRDGLIRGVAREGLRDLGSALRAAAIGRSGPDALIAAARAYREFARAHPGRYAATVAAPTREDPENEALAREAVEVVLAVLRAWALEGDDAIHAARAFRSTVHGFVALELSGGFGLPVDTDESFDRLIATLAAGLGGS